MIGHRLKLARAAAGLSLCEVSTRLGGRVSAEAIHQYEHDERMPASDVLIALARVLGVTEEFLLRNFDGDGLSAQARAQMNTLDLIGRCLMVEEILGTPAERIEQALSRWLESLCDRALSEGAISESKAAELLGVSTRDLNRRVDVAREIGCLSPRAKQASALDELARQAQELDMGY